jgi:hypothetical protein
VQVPADGQWRYRATGTRRIGLAGSERPFAEDVTATVTRAAGPGRASQEVRVLTSSASGTTDERRRYSSGGLDLLSLQVTSAGLGYGGTLEPPQRLLPARARVGDSWTSQWRATGPAGTTTGTTTATITGTREVQVEGRLWHCYEVDRDTTVTGAITGTQQQQTCWILALGMASRDLQRFTGTYQGVRFDAQIEMVLHQIPPKPDQTPAATLSPRPTDAATGPPPAGRAGAEVRALAARQRPRPGSGS